MSIGILIIAHAPLASALKESAMHVFTEVGEVLQAFDVEPDLTLDEILVCAQEALSLVRTKQTLILTDIVGGTPCNVAQKLVDGTDTCLVSGVNLPMILKALNYRSDSLERVTQHALEGGARGISAVPPAPNNISLINL